MRSAETAMRPAVTPSDLSTSIHVSGRKSSACQTRPPPPLCTAIVAEDEWLVRIDIVEALEAAGFAVREVETAEDATTPDRRGATAYPRDRYPACRRSRRMEPRGSLSRRSSGRRRRLCLGQCAACRPPGRGQLLLLETRADERARRCMPRPLRRARRPARLRRASGRDPPVTRPSRARHLRSAGQAAAAPA